MQNKWSIILVGISKLTLQREERIKNWNKYQLNFFRRF